MIAPLRRWHRRASALLAVAVPGILVAAIAARPDVPVNAALPSDSSSPAVRETRRLLWSRPDVLANLTVASTGANEIVVDTRSLASEPNVLLYLLEPGETSEPPAAGRLLGAVRGNRRQRIALPADVAERGGRLALYSLAHDEVLASAPIAATGGQP